MTTREHHDLGTGKVRLTVGHEGVRVHVLCDDKRTMDLLAMIHDHRWTQASFVLVSLGLGWTILTTLICRALGGSFYTILGCVFAGYLGTFGYYHTKVVRERGRIERLMAELAGDEEK